MDYTASPVAILKDIAYFYQVMSEYGYIMGDLDYINEFNGEYWRYLTVNQPEEFRRGALAILIAKVSDFIAGSGNTITTHLEDYKLALSTLYPQSSEEDRLIEIARLGVKIADGQLSKAEEFETSLPWVYEVCVNKYFFTRSKLSK